MAKTSTKRNTTRYHFEQQDGKCYYCQDEVFLSWTVDDEYREENRYRMATFDHIKPASKGGTWRRDNGVCACRLCNEVRGTMPFEEFAEKAVQLVSRRKKRMGNKRRLRAKRHRNFLMNSYLVARFAQQAQATVEQAFVAYVEPEYWQETA